VQDIRNYRINTEIGRGKGAVVYHATDTQLKRDVALKICDEGTFPRERVIQLKQESAVLSWLHVDAVPAFYELFQEGTYHCLVMDFIQGKNLETLLKKSPEPISQYEAIEWGIRICDVLHALHTHNTPHVYRYIKPENVILNQQREIFLVDYGKTVPYYPAELYPQTGTPGYAPPEQYVGRPEPRSDIYSLGALLYHAVTGYDPRLQNRAFLFHVKPPRNFIPDISEGFEDVILRAVEHKVSDRYASAAAMRSALVRCRKPDLSY
jgi:eukaryotic-like serine/threonine-protein kinase